MKRKICAAFAILFLLIILAVSAGLDGELSFNTAFILSAIALPGFAVFSWLAGRAKHGK